MRVYTMKKFTLAAVLITAMLLTACGGGSGGSMPEVGKANVRIKVSADNFKMKQTRTSKRIAYNSVTIGSIILSHQKSGGSIQSQEVLQSVIDETPVTLSLELGKSYSFGVEALSASDVTLCAGNTTATITSSTSSITLNCVGGGTTITGVAASGVPVVGTVYVKDSLGNTTSAPIGSGGEYTLDVTGMQAPFIIKVVGTANGKPVQLYSAANLGQTVANVNDYTSLALAIAVEGAALDTVFTNPASFATDIQDNIENAADAVLDIFADLISQYEPGFDPFAGDYEADGTGMDGILDNIKIVLTGTSFKITDTEGTEIVPPTSVTTPTANPISSTYIDQIVDAVTEQNAIRDMILDFYVDHAGGIYVSDFFSGCTYHDGEECSTFSASPLPSDVLDVEDFRVLDKTVTSGATTGARIAYVNLLSDNTKEFKTAEVIKSGGEWLFVGNENRFKADGGYMYIMGLTYNNDAPVTDFTTALTFNIENTSSLPSTPESFSVTGAGITGLICYNRSGDEYFISGSSKILEIDDLDIEDIQAEFDTNGYVAYAFETYSNADCGVSQSMAVDYMVYGRIKSDSDLNSEPFDNYFLYQTNATDNLNYMLTDLTPEVQTNLANINSINASGIIMCDTVYGTSLTDELMFAGTVVSGNYHLNGIADASLIEQCMHSFVTVDNFDAAYMTVTQLFRFEAGDSGNAMTEARELMDTDLILGDNISLDVVDSDLDLSALTYYSGSYGILGIEWYSLNTSIISDTGALVASPIEPTEVELLAVVTYVNGDDYAIDYINITVTVDLNAGSGLAVLENLAVEDILGINRSADHVIFDLELDFSVGEVAVECLPLDTTYISEMGEIISRPVSLAGADVDIECIVPAAGQSSVTFTVTVGGVLKEKLAAGEYASYYIREGELYGFGNNEYWQLGLGENSEMEYAYANKLSTHVDFAAVSGGQNHAMAINDSGELRGTGDASGVFGVDGMTALYEMTYIQADADGDSAVDNDWVQVSAGADFTIALKADGTIWVSGLNDLGQLGLGDYTDVTTFTMLTETGWAYVSAGKSHVLAIKTDGTVWSWGSNYEGQLGVTPGTIASRTYPEQVAGISDIVYVKAGDNSSFAIDKNGHLYAWGDDFNGNYIPPTTMLTADDTNTEFVKVAAGSEHALAIGANGKLYAWGRNSSAQFGDGEISGFPIITSPTVIDTNTDWTDIAAGYKHSLGERADAELYAWGLSDSGQAASASNVVLVPTYVDLDSTGSVGSSGLLIAMGYGHTMIHYPEYPMAVPLAVGDNSYYQLGSAIDDPTSSEMPLEITGISDIVQLTAGYRISAAVTLMGEVYYWGSLFADYIEGTGFMSTKETPSVLTGTYVDISAGADHLLLLDDSGQAHAMGKNDMAQFCAVFPDVEGDDAPAPISGAKGISRVFAGDGTSFFIKTNGDLYGCGDNTYGQLAEDYGSKASISAFEWLLFTSDLDWTFITSANKRTHGIDSEGLLWSWGVEDAGELGVNCADRSGSEYFPEQVLTEYSPETWHMVAAGIEHTVGIKTDGTLWAWGSNYNGQLGVPLGELMDNFSCIPVQIGSDSNWTEVYARGYSTIAVNADGAVYAAGANGFGQLLSEDTNDITTGLQEIVSGAQPIGTN
jgi:alpha-tubulin suppressor-like RCC1 family protein